MKFVLLMSLVALLLSFFLLSCTPDIRPDQQCQTAADCVPDACCHAHDVVNTQYAPDCSGVFCTMNCEPGTLDCGQAKIDCLAGACTVIPEESI